MIRQVSEELRKSLLSQQESGMGYQLVEAEYVNGTRDQLLALNASFLANNWSEVRKAVTGHRSLVEMQLKTAAAEATLQNPPAIRSLRVTKAASAVREATNRGPASEASDTPTKAGDEFRRFSAFENDRRITENGGLLPGTYSTTSEDGDRVKTGEQAVQRYALPNPTPACYEFVIRPPATTTIKQGTAQPAYGQPGGGVEVIFVNGSPDKAVTRGRTLPER